MTLSMIQNQANSSFAYLRRMSGRCLGQGSTFSRSRAAGKNGAVHYTAIQQPSNGAYDPLERTHQLYERQNQAFHHFGEQQEQAP
jgi:hypothetical protein